MAEQEAGISWRVQTHEHKERSADWYWTLGALAFFGALVSLYFSNVLLAIILVVSAGSIGFLAVRGPREHSVRIDTRGINLDGTLYHYASLHSFDIVETGGQAQLVIATTGILMPHIVLSLEGVSQEAVRMTLRRHMLEEKQEPRFSDVLAELFGL